MDVSAELFGKFMSYYKKLTTLAWDFHFSFLSANVDVFSGQSNW
jgi:hypothetical protein